MSEENVELSSLPNFFYYNDLISKISGLWIPGKQFSFIFKMFYLSYILILYTMGISFIFLEIFVLKRTTLHINFILSILEILLTQIVGLFKLGMMILRRKNIKKLIDTLQDTKYQYDSSDEYKPFQIFLREKKVNSITAVTIFFMYSFAAIFAIISMYTRVLNEVKVEKFEGTNVTCYDYLTYYHYIPFNIDSKTNCLRYSFYQGISLLNSAWIVATADALLIGLNNCLQAQLKILGGAFNTLRKRTLKNINLAEDFAILHDEDYPLLEKKLFSRLSHCISHLKLLISVKDEVEYMFSFITLLQTIASLLIIASSLFITSTMPVTSPEFLPKMQYFVCALTQLFLICWSGNRITLAAGQINYCLFDSDWFSSSKRFKKSLLLTMTRMQRPLYLTIGKFSPITLSTVMVVCRGSFSYFTLFKSI